jgi:hypothetical protein
MLQPSLQITTLPSPQGNPPARDSAQSTQLAVAGSWSLGSRQSHTNCRERVLKPAQTWSQCGARVGTGGHVARRCDKSIYQAARAFRVVFPEHGPRSIFSGTVMCVRLVNDDRSPPYSKHRLN